MQTMPSKNRTQLAITGIALLVLVIGLIVYGVGQRTRQEAREIDPMVELAGPENGVAGQPEEAMNAAAPVTDMGTVEAVEATDATDATDTTAMAIAEASGQAEANPLLTTMSTVPETHLVQSDETLYSISMKYYATHIYAGDIEQLNNLTNPNQIQAGMELKLPRPEDLMAVGQ